MMPEDRIRTLAEEFAAQSQSQARRLKAELLEAQQRLSEIKAKLDATNLAFTCLVNFRIRSDGDLQCPRCGILIGVQAAMTCRPGQPTLDLFQCDTCGFDMDVPAFAGRSA